MISRNLRHLRVFLAIAEKGSATLAAELCHVSQPAVTQAIGKLEKQAGGTLFDRTRQGFFPTERGHILAARVRRAFGLLDPALSEISPRLCLTATAAQLRALIAVAETENFTLAANMLGLAQPTVHRALSQLEQEAPRALFERTPHGLLAIRACRMLARAARLAFAELDQAETELAELDGREAGRVVIGALPLSRSVILPRALIEFRKCRPRLGVRVADGPYADLLAGLRRGEIDIIVGALRDPPPIADVVQERLFDDRLTVLAGNHHPLVEHRNLSLTDLAGYPWVVPRAGSPSRKLFERVFASLGDAVPESIIETGSILLMREVLSQSDHLGCISAQQAKAEVSKRLLTPLDVAADCWPARAIGITYRTSWSPTAAQQVLIDEIRKSACMTMGNSEF